MFILGSGSVGRLKVIKQAGFLPDLIEPANVDETPLKNEKPLDYIKRIANLKCDFMSKKYPKDIILTGDTIITLMGRFFQKCHDEQEFVDNLGKYSGKSIKVISSACVFSGGKIAQKTRETSVKFKHFNQIDIDDLVKINEWQGASGGVYVEGLMASFIIKIVGSYTNIIGLPMYEVSNMLISAGIKRKI
jgi:septum formation protein